jgi:hypothetical protein
MGDFTYNFKFACRSLLQWSAYSIAYSNIRTVAARVHAAGAYHLRHAVDDSESCPPVSMNALRSAAAFRYVRVPRIHVTTCLRSHATAYWHRSPVRLGPHPSFFLPPRPVLLSSRTFRHFAQQENEKSVPSAPQQVTPAAPKAVISNAEQRRRDWAIVRRLAVHIWPRNDWGTRGRVVLGVGLLVCGKVRLLSRCVRASEG